MADSNPNQRFLMLTELRSPQSLGFKIASTAFAVGVFHPYADIPIGQRYDVAYARNAPDEHVQVSFTLAYVTRMGRELPHLKAGKAATCVFETNGNLPDIVSSLPPRLSSTHLSSSVALCTNDDWPVVCLQKCDNPLVLGEFGAVSESDIDELFSLLPPTDPQRICIGIRDATNAQVSSVVGGNSTKIKAKKINGSWVATDTSRGIV